MKYGTNNTLLASGPSRSLAAIDSTFVRNGMVSIKADGFASWLWRPKWLVLKEQTLSIHKTEVRSMFIPSALVAVVTLKRVPLKPLW
jgi:protein-serine/threonine kinase